MPAYPVRAFPDPAASFVERFQSWKAGLVDTAAVVARIAADVSRQLKLPDFQERLTALGVDAAGTTPAEFKALFTREVATWAKVVKAAKVALD